MTGWSHAQSSRESHHLNTTNLWQVTARKWDADNDVPSSSHDKELTEHHGAARMDGHTRRQVGPAPFVTHRSERKAHLGPVKHLAL